VEVVPNSADCVLNPGGVSCTLSAAFTILHTNNEQIISVKVKVDGNDSGTFPVEPNPPTSPTPSTILHTYTWSDSTIPCGAVEHTIVAIATVQHEVASNVAKKTCPACPPPPIP
jgi:hypothetical protein